MFFRFSEEHLKSGMDKFRFPDLRICTMLGLLVVTDSFWQIPLAILLTAHNFLPLRLEKPTHFNENNHP